MTRLFLTNIPYDCHENQLQRWIESRGFEVDSVRLVRDQVAGVSPSFGYVSVRTRTAAGDVIEVLDGQPLNGRRVHVKQDWRDEYDRG